MTSAEKSEQQQSSRDLQDEERNALFDRILADIAVHGSANRAIKENGGTNSAFYARLERDVAAQERYARARSAGMRAIADETIAIADDPDLDPNDKRIRIDTRKWLLSKLVPKQYGEKLDVAHSGEVTVNFTPGDASVL